MDAQIPSVDVVTLAAQSGRGDGPLVIDVRRVPAFETDKVLIAGAIRRQPETVGEWAGALPRREIVVYCVRGHEVSQNACRALLERGHRARILAGGIEDWKAKGLPTVTRRPPLGQAPSRWITRARPKIDRIACPWLIRRFLDPLAEIHYVPPAGLPDAARRLEAIPFDTEGAEFGHRAERCSFDAFLDEFGLRAPGLDRLAQIVRGADTKQLDLAPEAAGLLAISNGLGLIFADDQAMLAHGLTLYDALYAHCRAGAGETR
jgi:rhodanese-related sulfurtransferase